MVGYFFGGGGEEEVMLGGDKRGPVHLNLICGKMSPKVRVLSPRRASGAAGLAGEGGIMGCHGAPHLGAHAWASLHTGGVGDPTVVGKCF